MKLIPSLSGLRLRWKLLRRVLFQPANLYEIPIATQNPLEFFGTHLSLGDYPTELSQIDPLYVGDQGVVENSEPEVSRLFYFLAKLMNACEVAEVGVYHGYTSRHLAEAIKANPSACLHLVDLSTEALQKAKNAVHLSGVRTVTHLGFSTEESLLKQIPDNLDLIYLDADHSEEGVKKELEVWFPKLRLGGFVGVHDTIHYNGICKAVNSYTKGNPSLTFATSRGCGLTLIQRTQKS
jgi:predicted O-methyltransferase YrrM